MLSLPMCRNRLSVEKMEPSLALIPCSRVRLPRLHR
ncbi:hypothetical protein LINPERHAP1_LOCUS5355 [Linum perenne]